MYCNLAFIHCDDEDVQLGANILVTFSMISFVILNLSQLNLDYHSVLALIP